jgi:hypothetical protein
MQHEISKYMALYKSMIPARICSQNPFAVMIYTYNILRSQSLITWVSMVTELNFAFISQHLQGEKNKPRSPRTSSRFDDLSAGWLSYL